MLQILGILENFDLASLEPASLKAVHLFAEAGRLVYADRTRILYSRSRLRVRMPNNSFSKIF